jgi:exopolyphosphatase/guanosine-5'-triphosphate,3'-diphosphate pyrophosphatase
MVIFQKTSRFSFRLLKEVKSRVRIGEGAYENGGVLQDFAMDRAYIALKDFLSIANDYGVRKTLCVATSALRDAPNAKVFINRVSKGLGLNIKVIDGTKEAYLGGVAAANLLYEKKRACTVDIGGGSTEFAVIEEGKVIQTLSVDIGTVRIKELFFDRGDAQSAMTLIKREFEKLRLDFDTVIAIGGTARALSKSIMKTTRYPLDKLHGFSYEVANYRQYIEKILHTPEKKLKKLKIKNDRIDTIKPGVAIFLSVLDALGAKRVITSGVGVREGLFLSDLLRTNNHRFPPNFNPSVKNMIVKYYEKDEYLPVFRKAVKLFEAFEEKFALNSDDYTVLTTAAKLVQVGNYVNIYQYNGIGEMLILNELSYGFSHNQIAEIATLVKYSKNKIPPKTILLASLIRSYEKLLKLKFLLSLALKLDYNTTFALKGDTLEVQCDYLVQAELESLHLPYGLKLKVTT